MLSKKTCTSASGLLKDNFFFVVKDINSIQFDLKQSRRGWKMFQNDIDIFSRDNFH